jgi:hypothetical protein
MAAKPTSIKDTECKSSGCALKAVELTSEMESCSTAEVATPENLVDRTVTLSPLESYCSACACRSKLPAPGGRPNYLLGSGQNNLDLNLRSFFVSVSGTPTSCGTAPAIPQHPNDLTTTRQRP